MSVEDVRQASDRFYAALNRGINGDTSEMFEICSHAADVTTMHPLGGRQTGWPEVRATWEMAAGAIDGGPQAAERQRRFPHLDLAHEGHRAGHGAEAGVKMLGHAPFPRSSSAGPRRHRHGKEAA